MSASSADWGPRPFWKWAPYTKSRYFVGFDVGQARDSSALVVLERRQEFRVGGHSKEHRPYGEPEYRAIDAARLPLQTTYPVQAAYVAERMRRAPLADGAELIVDRSGIGRAVFDELAKLRVPHLCGVTITGGEEPARDGGLNWRVPKVRLVQVVDARLNDGSLRLSAEMPLADELRRELEDFRVSFTGGGAMTFAAAGSGHDDLALALSLALWAAAARPSGEMFRVRVRGL